MTPNKNECPITTHINKIDHMRRNSVHNSKTMTTVYSLTKNCKKNTQATTNYIIRATRSINQNHPYTNKNTFSEDFFKKQLIDKVYNGINLNDWRIEMLQLNIDCKTLLKNQQQPYNF